MSVEEPISKVNLERLTNGIYAFTMTLLVRNIQVPPAGTFANTASFIRYIDTTVLAVVDFIGAFLILGMFWLFYFQMFHRMRTFDYRFLYIHLLSLMIVVFVPFTQSFTSQSTQFGAADIVFQVNYLVLSIVLVYAWHYAWHARPSLLVPELTGEEASYLQKKFFIPLGVAIIGVLFIILGFPYFDILYLLPFVILIVFFRQPLVIPEKNG
jgi:uncharacterized membrane protein